MSLVGQEHRFDDVRDVSGVPLIASKLMVAATAVGAKTAHSAIATKVRRPVPMLFCRDRFSEPVQENKSAVSRRRYWDSGRRNRGPDWGRAGARSTGSRRCLPAAPPARIDTAVRGPVRI